MKDTTIIAPEQLPGAELLRVNRDFNKAMRRIMGDDWTPAPLLPTRMPEARDRRVTVCALCGKCYRIGWKIRDHLRKCHNLDFGDLIEIDDGLCVWRTVEGQP